MGIIIGIYDDHSAFMASDDLTYIYLCESCAEYRGGDVTHLVTLATEDPTCCERCGDSSSSEEEEDY